MDNVFERVMENAAGSHDFLLFPQRFVLPYQRQNFQNLVSCKYLLFSEVQIVVQLSTTQQIIKTTPNLKHLQNNVTLALKIYLVGVKTLWEKKKILENAVCILVYSSFSCLGLIRADTATKHAFHGFLTTRLIQLFFQA